MVGGTRWFGLCFGALASGRVLGFAHSLWFNWFV